MPVLPASQRGTLRTAPGRRSLRSVWRSHQPQRRQTCIPGCSSPDQNPCIARASVPPPGRAEPAQQERNSSLPAWLATLTWWATVATAGTAPGALRFRPRLIDVEGAPTEACTVQGGYGLVGSSRVRHLHESKTSRAARIPIRRYVDTFHSSIRFEERTDRIFGRIEIQVAYK